MLFDFSTGLFSGALQESRKYLERRLGHSSISIMEKYLRNTLALDTERL